MLTHLDRRKRTGIVGERVRLPRNLGPPRGAFSAGLFLLAVCLQGQSVAPSAGDLPLPDPGYRLYYHGDQGLAEKASRWGYHEGWRDGRSARNQGKDSEPLQGDNYQTAPDHGVNPGVTRSQYVRIYRIAYLRGYEHGYRL